MGIFGVIWKAIKKAASWVADKLSGGRFDNDSLSDHVNVDAVLTDVKRETSGQTSLCETECMNKLEPLFAELQAKTQEQFPDLCELVKNKRGEAQKKLRGTVSRYVNEHLSKNNPKFRTLLEMSPGAAKKEAIQKAVDQIHKNAEEKFFEDLAVYVDAILKDFRERLDRRILDQENRLERYVVELDELKEAIEKNQIDIDNLKERATPSMETAQCMIDIIGTIS